MKKSSWRTLLVGVVVAIIVNIGLFAIIPQLAQKPAENPLPLRRQKVQLFKSPLEEPPPVAKKIIKPVEQKIVPRPSIMPAPSLNIETPQLHAVLPEPDLNMTYAAVSAGIPQSNGFFEADQLDQLPTLSYQVAPIYPYRAKRMNMHGHVKISFQVASDGTVNQVEILESEPQGIFDDAVLQAVAKWRYQPGELMGESVTTRMVKTIVFNLEE